MGNQQMCMSSQNSQKEAKYEEMIICGSNKQFRNSTVINIVGDIPIIYGPPLNFHKNGTFDKVQKSAAEFCHKNQLDNSFIPVAARIIAYGHNNIFRAYQKLQGSHRQQFLQELKYIDFQFLDSLYHSFILEQRKQHSFVTAPIKVVDYQGLKQESINKYIEYGRKLIRNREVGFIFLCGGSSSRFQHQDKFLCPLKIKSEKSTLQLYFERVRKNCEVPEGHIADIPILITCNPQNRFIVEEFLKKNKYFGFNISKIRFITIKNLPILDAKGKVCLNFQSKFLSRPQGTLKSIQEFFNSGSYHFFNAENVSTVSIHGCENLTQNPGDPFYLGYLIHHQLDMLGKCVDPLYGTENFIRFASSKAKNYVLSTQNIITILNHRTEQILEKCPIAMNSMICNLHKLNQLIRDPNNSMFLSKQFRPIKNAENYYNFELERPEIRTDVISFEKDIQHLFSCSDNYKIVKVPKHQFVPLMSKNSSYSLQQASKRLIQNHEIQMQHIN